MKRIADFIIENKYKVLITMLIITVICGALAFTVDINTDMTKYLPDDSSMKKGIDIMAEEFPDMQVAKTVRVMFEDMSPEDTADMLTRLENIEYVSSVDFDLLSEDYYKDNYALYILSTEYDYGSPEEKSIEKALEKDFDEHNMQYKNDNTVTTEIPAITLILAIFLILVVLLIMCSSWIEPIIFLASIGIAVVINLGTNCIFDSISYITFAIAALLQLVLSMDYSIILMSRFRQELKLDGDKTAAMKRALANAFSSITASSVTTFVGLLALVFMSFKIGADLGFVLAKGVLCSLICVFTVLPVLILHFDALIEKTAKKEPVIPMGGLAKFSYKTRYILCALFIPLFILMFFCQRETDTAYTLSTKDPIADVFPKTGTLVILYDNDDEEKIGELSDLLEADENIQSVLNYSTTLGRKYTAEELADVVSELGSDISLEPSLLQLVYYEYFDGSDVSVPLGSFLSFITNDIIPNQTFSSYISSDMRSNSAALGKFSSAEELNSPKTAAQLASFFGMSEEQAAQIISYYYIKNGTDSGVTMTVSRFADFLINDVAKDPAYADMIDASYAEKLSQMSAFTDKSKVTTAYDASAIASMLGIDDSTAEMLFLYYYAETGAYTPGNMTVWDFVSFLNSDVVSNAAFSAYFDSETTAQLSQLETFANPSTISQKMTASQLADLFGMSSAEVAAMMLISGKLAMTPLEFVNFVISDVASNPLFSSQISAEQLSQLKSLQTIMQASSSGTAYSPADMAALFGVDASQIRLMYVYHDYKTGRFSLGKLSLYTLLNFLSENSSMLSGMMSAEELAGIKTAAGLVNGTVSGKKYSASEMAELLGMSAGDVSGIYVLYASKNADTSALKLSPMQFVDFLDDVILSDPDYSSQFSSSDAASLKSARKLIDAVATGQSYNSAQMAELLSGLGTSIDAGTMDLLFLYYAGIYRSNPAWELSILDLFDFLSEDLLNDSRFAGFLTDDIKNSINDYKVQINDGINQLVGENYSICTMYSWYPAEGEETTAFFDWLDNWCKENLSGEYYFIGDSAMSWEMEKSFNGEMLLITLLTAAAIFLVVLITFRSFIIPLILVLIVQCGVFLTVAVVGWQGYSIYYLALLVVQCILMGATIDYGILLTTYYREKRQTMGIADSIKAAYDGSVHTILTSGIIMVIVCAMVAPTFGEPTVEQICRTISIGAFCAIMLIVFILPGILATFDKLVCPKAKRRQDK